MDNIELKQVDITMLDSIAELEKLCFCCPWSQQALKMLCKEGAFGFAVFDSTGKLCAYGGMITVLDEGQITNIACHPAARRQGFGNAVTRALIEHGIKNGIKTFSLEVRRSNLAAISMYKKLGFSEVGVRKNFYTAPSEDAIVMIKNIGELPFGNE